jgi:proteasome lid subunit RPN8/RPN11
MRIPGALADELVAHAHADLPNECCGLIAGRDGVATRVMRATNAEGSPFFYVFDPREQLEMMEEIEDAGEDVLAIYHSHTRSAAYPSRTDVDLAFYAQPLYVIISLADRERPDIRAFRIARDGVEGEQIREEPIEVG